MQYLIEIKKILSKRPKYTIIEVTIGKLNVIPGMC